MWHYPYQESAVLQSQNEEHICNLLHIYIVTLALLVGDQCEQGMFAGFVWPFILSAVAVGRTSKGSKGVNMFRHAMS